MMRLTGVLNFSPNLLFGAVCFIFRFPLSRSGLLLMMTCRKVPDSLIYATDRVLDFEPRAEIFGGLLFEAVVVIH